MVKIKSYAIELQNVKDITASMESAVSHFNRDCPDAVSVSHSAIPDWKDLGKGGERELTLNICFTYQLPKK